MKKNITGLTAIVIIACGIIACTGCEKKNDSSTETTSVEELVQPLLGMFSIEDTNLLDLNCVDTSTYTAAELEQFFNSYLTLFINRACLIFYPNDDDPSLTDVLLVPLVADFAEIIHDCFVEAENNVMTARIKTKNKTFFQQWVTPKNEEGYVVISAYNKQTKEYEAIAYAKTEWAQITAAATSN